MTYGVLYLAASVLCSLSIAVLLRYNEGRRGSRTAVIAGNYVTATALGLGTWIQQGAIPLDGGIVILGLCGGVVFVGTFLLMTAAIGRVGIAIPVSVTRLSVVIPIGVSMFWYGELPRPVQAAGLAAALAALVLLGHAAIRGGASLQTGASGKWKPRLRNFTVVLGLFLSMGTVEVVLKAFKESRPHGTPYRPFGFLAVVFGFALCIAWSLILARGEKVRRSDFLLGLSLGVPNFFSTVFFLAALRLLPGIVVFPVNSMGVIALSAMAGVWVWKEKLRPAGWAAMALALAAIALINLG